MPNHPQRVWPLQGATNFRDLGGYPGQGLAKAFDFRGQAERAAVTYELPGVTQHSLAIEPTVVQRLQDLVSSGQALTPERTTELMTELYRALVNDQSHRFAELFEQLLLADGPVVMHCTAGKDRTGFAAALILLALGVRRDLVLEDYLITNRVFQHPSAAQGGLPAEVLAVLWRVQPGFLEAALQAVDSDHGGIERYLSQRLGLSQAARQQLAERYLAPA
jgi:protein-tyrosine phosphatase